ncbi:ribonuclease H-like domain-containing protein [Tanacetum coccineum]
MPLSPHSLSHTLMRIRLDALLLGDLPQVRNLRELLVPLRTATLVYYDSVSVVYLSCNPVQDQRMKHLEIDIHFVHDFIATGHVRVLHVPS